MKRLIQLMVLLSLVFTLSLAKDDWKKHITKEEALSAIEIFEKDPVGKNARGALSIVTYFTKYNDTVMLEIDKNLLPWIYKKDFKYRYSNLLLGSYIAGNVKARLKGSSYKDNRYEGALMVIKVYTILKNSNDTEEIASIEKWIEMKKKGTLKKVIKNK